MEQSYSPENPFAPKKKEEQGKYSTDNPFTKPKVEEPIVHSENPEPGLWAYLGNKQKYLMDVFPKLVQSIADPASIGKDVAKNPEVLGGAASILGQRALNTAESMIPSVPGNPGSMPMITNALTKGREVFNNVSLNPAKLLDMTIKGGTEMLFTPVEALTQTYDNNGVAVPTTPEHLASNIQTMIGMAVQGVATSRLMSAMSPELGPEAQIAFQNRSMIGKLATNIPKDVAANAIGGASFGMVSHAGDEDMLAKSIGDALAFAPLGVLFGSARSLGGAQATTSAVSILQDQTKRTAGELFGLRALQITPETSVSEVTGKIDAFAKSDNYIKAAVSTNLSEGKGFIVDSKIADPIALSQELASSARVSEGAYVPSEKVAGLLHRFKPNIGGVRQLGIKFLSDFDAAVYFSQSKKAGSIIKQELMDQTGLTEPEIKAHRLAIKEYIKQNANNAKQRSQVEIDQLNNEVIQRGETKLLTALDGTQFKDHLGNVWNKQGEMITDGKQTIDVKSNLAKQIAGRLPRDVESTAPYVEVPKQNFQPNFGRDVKDFFTYKGLGDIHYFSPEQLNTETSSFFERTGFLPNEIVSVNGLDHIVRGESKAGNLKLENLATGKSYFKNQGVLKGEPEAAEFTTKFKNYDRKYIVSKNTIPGEKPYRLSTFTKYTSEWSAEPHKEFNFFYDAIDEVKKIDPNLKPENIYHTPNTIQRKPSGLSSELYKAANGNEIARIGILNHDSFYKALYEKFKKGYDLEKEGNKSYQDQIMSFANNIGMKNTNDINLLSRTFQSYVKNDVIDMINKEDIEGGVHATKLMSAINEGSADLQSILDNKELYALNHAFDSANLYLVAEGNGVYDIRDLKSAKSLHKVSNYQEARDFVRQSGAANGFDLDGGDSNLIPPGAIGDISGSGRSSTSIPIYDKAHRLDLFNTGKYGSSLVPVGAELKSFDNLAITDGRKLNTTKYFRALQTAQGVLKNAGLTTFKPLSDLFNNSIKSYEKVEAGRRNIVSDYIEAQSLQELETTHVGRLMQPTEISIAKQIASKSISKDVINFMREVRQGTTAKVGTPEFSLKTKEIASKLNNSNQPLYTPDVTQAAGRLFDLTKMSPDAVSPYIILRYARALENPSMALDRAGFAAKHNMSADELMLARDIEKTFDEGATQFGIKNKIKGYLPHVEIGEAVGYNPWGDSKTNTQFAREMTRLGVNQINGALERDPAMLLRKYILAGSRTKKMIPYESAFPGEVGDPISFNEVLRMSENYAAEIGKDPANRSAAVAFNDHISQVKGIPDNSILAGQAADAMFQKIYGKQNWSGTKAAILLSHAALLGGRLSLTLRDGINGWMNVAAAHGEGIAFDMFNESVDLKYAKTLQEKGINIPQTGLDLLIPNETVHAGTDRISKLATTTMKYNGNQLLHSQMSAGLYKATIKQIGSLSADLLDTKKRANAQTKLRIEAEDPIIQQQFNDLIDAGKTQEAADILGRERVKKMLNVFGSSNNPRGWNTAFGRVAGGMMSWGINQAQTIASGLSRGTPAQRMMYGVRMGGYNGILAATGYASGLNLGGWLLNPFALVSTSPVLNAGIGAMKVATGLASTNVNTRGASQNAVYDLIPHDEHSLAQLYIPYSFMIQDWVDGVNMAQNDYGPTAIARGVGVGVNSSMISPLQDELGLDPRNIRTGSRLPRESLTKGEKAIKGIFGY